MIRWLIALPMLAACIEIPDDPNKTKIDAAVCASSFPPPTALMNNLAQLNNTIYTATTGLLNDDECEDFVLAALGDTPGFYVIYGPITDYANLEYHEFVSTGVAPYAIAVADVLNSPKQEVLVFGLGQSNGSIKLYETKDVADATTTRFNGPNAQSRVTGFDPGNGSTPVNLLVGDFGGGNGPRDIAVSGLNNLELYASDGGDEISAFQMTVVGSNGNNTPADWTDINVLTQSETSSGINALVVAEQGEITYYPVQH